MSKSGSPGHPSTPFESYYDPDFTAEISAKMHVPEKIRVIEGIESPESIFLQQQDITPSMQVPERILLAGGNQHIAVREPLPELKFDSGFPVQFPNYVLAPPPNVLTVDEYPYPAVDIKPAPKKESNKKSALDQALTGASEFNESSLSSAGPDDEVAVLRRQVRQLSRRVLALEQDNQQRLQR
ncbi:Mitochondrial fission factor, partial [Stegodyphus mimosarum]